MHLKFSQDLEFLLKQLASQPLTIQAILATTSERGFSLIIGLLVLPFLLPMPPGLGSILGFGCFLLAMQMALGRRSPWLPQKIAQYQFPHSFILQLLLKLKGVTRVLEKITRPRLVKVAESLYAWRVNGFCMAWLAVLLALPIPFTNPIPSAGILLLAVATMEADGLLMCIGYGLTAVITLFFAFIAYSLWQVPNWLEPMLNFPP